MSNNIYIYHIPGIKIGVTRNLYKRVTKQQGYKPGEFEILAVSTDIEFISQKEKALQAHYGYDQDLNSYQKINKQNKKKKGMQINITPATTTFPVPKNKLEDYLTENMGFRFKTPLREHVIDDDTAEWIVKNARVSHFNPKRSYVYNKSLAAFDEEAMTEKEFVAKNPIVNAAPGRVEARYNAIRSWASERGLYESGDQKTQLVKLVEEQGELAKAILKNDYNEIRDGIGDMIVVLTNLAFLSGMKVEECIDAAYNEIKDRQGGMINGTFVKATL